MTLLTSAAFLTCSLVFVARSAHPQTATVPDSNDAEALYQLGLASYRAGAMAEARSLFAAAVRTDPRLALGYIALAQFHPFCGGSRWRAGGSRRDFRIG